MYALGAAYVITSDLFRDLFKISEYVPWIHIDDLYVTGFLARILKVNHVNQYGFISPHQKECEVILGRIVASFNIDPQLINYMWKEIKELNSTTCAKYKGLSWARGGGGVSWHRTKFISHLAASDVYQQPDRRPSE